jgi:hypothetical protein
MPTERRQLLKNDKYVEGDDCHLFVDIITAFLLETVMI